MPFDPQAFLDLPMEVPLEKRAPIPATDYIATIKDLEPRQWQSKDKYDENGQLKSGLVFDVQITLDIPQSIVEMLSLKSASLTVKDGIMVDMQPGGGYATGPGQNSRLRQYREALDMNKAGEAFRPRAMIGRALKVRVTHDTLPDGAIVERIGALARAS
jgi:hypothetical protein